MSAATVIRQAIDAALGSTPTGNLSRHSFAEKSRYTYDARAGGREILDVFGESDPIPSTSRSLDAA